jgi:hypothetical protein
VKREEITEILADFSAPLDPDVFAGFGSELQNHLAKWSKEGELFLEKTDAFISEWTGNVDFEETWTALIDILKNPPGREFYNNFCERRKDDWEYSLSTFITALAKRNPISCVNELQVLVKDPRLTIVVSEILEIVEEGQS